MICASACVSVDDGLSCSGLRRVDPPRRPAPRRAARRRSAAGRPRRAGPSSGAGWSRCRWRSAWARTGTVETTCPDAPAAGDDRSQRPAPPRRRRRLRRPADAPSWLDVDWREHQRRDEHRRARPSTSSTPARARPAPLVFVHGLAGCGRTGCENIPPSRATTACIALDLPGLRRLRPMPRGRRSRSRATRTTLDALCDRLGYRAAVVVSATRWAASSPPSWRSAFPTRVDSASCSSPRPAWRSTYQRAGRPLCGVERLSDRGRRADAERASTDAVVARPRLRQLCAAAAVVALPGPACGARSRESCRRAAQPGFIARARGADDLPARGPALPIDVPDADRLGRATTCSCRSATPSASSELIADNAAT